MNQFSDSSRGGGKSHSQRRELVHLAADMLLRGEPCIMFLDDPPWPAHSYVNWTKQVIRERDRSLSEETIEMMICGLQVSILNGGR